jgi:hypothetical protein
MLPEKEKRIMETGYLEKNGLPVSGVYARSANAAMIGIAVYQAGNAGADRCRGVRTYGSVNMRFLHATRIAIGKTEICQRIESNAGGLGELAHVAG